jgi:hypothetical protein
VVSSHEGGDESSGSGATELVSYYYNRPFLHIYLLVATNIQQKNK